MGASLTDSVRHSREDFSSSYTQLYGATWWITIGGKN